MGSPGGHVTWSACGGPTPSAEHPFSVAPGSLAEVALGAIPGEPWGRPGFVGGSSGVPEWVLGGLKGCPGGILGWFGCGPEAEHTLI